VQRVTITLDDDLMAELDSWIVACGYQNRSEAIRDLTRAGLRQLSFERTATQDCVAALIYVYDHATRELSKRLVHAFHDRHKLSVATMHVHLDHGSCMELTVLKGRTDEVQHFAEHVIAERGVRHGRVVVVPNDLPATGAPPGRSHKHAHRAESDQVLPVEGLTSRRS
jgi:CopG family transcriptional regulator, nickel-responsive regulator